ncbi:dTMP kinase [Desulfotruncus alcoholivorax]|uniref:dTMP kinase n=1 Tax=Desulfotruncus alcoholivorax TaxID=265477 RepID=UPI000400088F|nr:dTMP kinase [Desulfotruncus alcoholivorax]
MVSGKFIVFEGIDGAGKTTQIDLVAKNLKEQGLQVLCTREPGGTRIGEMLRKFLLDPANGDINPRTEAFLYAADRSQHVTEVILPALEEGKIVICDRYLYSTIAYQGWGRGIDTGFLTSLNGLASDGLVPDRVILLDIDVDTGLQRALGERLPDRLEIEKNAFFQRVRQGYLEQAKLHPEIFRVIQAGADKMEVNRRVLAALDWR